MVIQRCHTSTKSVSYQIFLLKLFSRDCINIIFRYRQKYRNIKIQPLQMNVTMSSVLDLENTSVRVLWFKRDFYSDYCPSYLPSLLDMKFQNFDFAMDEEMKIRKNRISLLIYISSSKVITKVFFLFLYFPNCFRNLEMYL